MIMKWIFGTTVVGGMAALALGFMLVFTGSSATDRPDDTRKLAAALVTDGNGMSEGIQVHGDWSIEVSDPDGTLVEKREFKNALAFPQGTDLLLWLLAGERLIDRDRWRIQLKGEAEFTGENINYVGEEFFIENAADGVRLTLDGVTGVVERGFHLTGSTTVSISEPTYAQTVINTVKTIAQGQCTEWDIENTGPCGTDEALVYDFTEHTLNDPVTIKQDQKVKVEVKISFN